MQMTPKRFVRASKKDPVATLTAHWDFLRAQSNLTDILNAYEAASLTPEATLTQCQSVLFWASVENDLREADAKLIPAPKPPKLRASSGGSRKLAAPLTHRYAIRILGKLGDGSIGTLEQERITFNDKGEKEVELIPLEYRALDYSAAERLADRRLVQREDALLAEITNLIGKELTTIVERRDAIARVLVKKRGAVMKAGKRTSSLRWQPKAHPTRSITRWSIPR